MSDMVQKMEQPIGDPLQNKAQCPLSYFRDNILDSWFKVVAEDATGPSQIEIWRHVEKKVELWTRARPLKGNDWMFEKVGSWPFPT